MRPLPIRFDQGLNLGQPVDDLREGELRLARNAYYRPESLALRKIWGRDLRSSIAAAAATGLDYVRFRSGTAFLVGTAGTAIKSAQLPLADTWASLKTLSATAGRAEVAYYNGTDRAYWFDGTNTPQVWAGGATTRDFGLNSPTTAPVLAVVANAATLLTAGMIFQYAFAEYDSVNDVESGPSPVATVSVNAAGDTIKVTLPARVNAAADKFRVYRTQDGGDVLFRIAEVTSYASASRYYDGDDTEGLTQSTDNDTVWGFKTVDDIFLSTRPTLPMVGGPLSGNYITTNAKPPNGDIITIFENSLCVSGVTTFPQDIYYSQPDAPEQFSPVHFLREENPRGDPVTAMGTANDRLVGFTLNSIYRHDTLPRVTDPGFGVGLASRQLVTDDHGCVAKRTVVNYGVGAPNNRLFYLSSRGPFATDGYRTQPIGEDLNWDSSLINFSNISRAIARNYPKYFVIVLAVPSASSTVNDIAWIYHYHPFHAKREGAGKWTGPMHIRAGAMATAHLTDTETRLYTADNDTSGNVYQEDSGTLDDSAYENTDGRIDWEIETGDQRVGSETRLKRIGRVFLSLEGTADGAPRLEYALSKRDAVRPVTLTRITKAFSDTQKIGTSTGVTRSKTRTYRGGVWKAGTHVRVRISENVASVDRAISTLEAEAEDWGGQK